MIHKLELTEKNREDIRVELELFEKQYEEDRIVFVKKIEGLNFELSRKEK